MIVVFLLVAITTLCALLAVGALVEGRREERFASLDRRIRVQGDMTGPLDLARAARLAQAGGVEQWIQDLPGADHVEKMLVQADLQLSVVDLLVRSLGSALGGAFAVGLLLHGAFGAFLGFTGFLFLPYFLVLRKRAQRSQEISRQLPEALEMITRSLQAGHPLESAMEVVGAEVAPPLGLEFAKCREEQRLGRTFEDAIVALANRVPDNMELRIFAVSATVLRETGGNLVQVLDKLGNTLRDRQLFAQKVRTLTADSRASGQILAAMPVGMLLLLVVVNPEYISSFVDDPLGIRIGLIGLGCWLLGVYALRRMSKVRL